MTPDLPDTAAGAPRPEPGREGEALRDCAALIGLLADQMEALEAGDYRRLRELDALRAKLVDEMRAEDDPDADAPLLRQLVIRLENALERVDGWIEHDRRSRAEIDHLRDGALPLARDIRRRLPGGNYLSLNGDGGTVDVRF